jgi:hypothetical protein
MNNAKNNKIFLVQIDCIFACLWFILCSFFNISSGTQILGHFFHGKGYKNESGFSQTHLVALNEGGDPKHLS